MAQYGLLGEKLSHSYSPQIHSMLGDVPYDLFEKQPEELESFLREGSWDGLNVTIPYKKAVIPYLDEISPEAREAGAVNTMVKRNGRIYGDNTDITGFRAMVLYSGVSVAGKKALVLGSGGASRAVCIALRSLDCTPVVISRSGPDNYENIGKHSDARIIVNATPVGMYPHNGETPLSLAGFSACEAVFDLIYNPFRTKLLLEAEERGIPHVNGLYMLVAQAKRSAEIFTDTPIADSEIERIYRALALQMSNLVLVGMPGVGKTTKANAVSALTGRPVLDSDVLFAEQYGCTAAEMITSKGEDAFRLAEHEVLCQAGKRSGAIIATGGGVVTRRMNYEPLHQNGIIVWLQRRLEDLSIKNRPLSQRNSLEDLYAVREPLYRAFADYIVDLDAEDGVAALMKLIGGTTE